MPDNLMDKVVSDKDFSKHAAEDIRRLVDEEMSKPAKKRDYRKISELSNAYCEILDAEELTRQSSQSGIEQVLQKARETNQKPSKRIMWIMTMAITVAILAIANVATVTAWDMDVFTAIIHFTKDGFSVDFPDREAIVLPTSEDDPYGIKEECAKYGLEVEAPSYLPEGFVLGNVENELMDDYKTYVNFHFYGNGKEKIQISYNLYDEKPNYGIIPSDKFNLSEQTVNGKPAIVSKEEDQYTIIWADENLKTVISSQNLDYDECDKIVASLK